jgi:antitoxin (DNA-binding transcriptional repressor) of toxin-antitoxin stability system
MHTVELEDAEKQLSKLVDEAVNGESFVIARDGKPLVKVEALQAAPTRPRRIGFLDGEIAVPEDFDRMGEKEIAELFGTDV